jgi:hypothetical protein
MRFICLLVACSIVISLNAQTDTAENILPTVVEQPKPQEKQPTHVFEAQRAVNANTVAMIRKGTLEFKVTHNFDDFAGKFGGLKNFFGLDNAVDLRIGFQYGISNHFNIIFARYRGDGRVQRIYELGLKWLVAQQMDNDPSHPFSMALYGNAAVATNKAGTNPELENFVHGLSERMTYMGQAIIAKKFGKKLSLQLNPTITHRNNVIRKFPPAGVPITPANEDNIAHDQKTIFALGGAARWHLGGRYALVVDYFHPFRKQASIDSFRTKNIRLFDPIGVGFEMTTWGHIFQIFFTNATDILENKFIPFTIDTWKLGQFRWGFSIAREFEFKKKKKKK